MIRELTLPELPAKITQVGPLFFKEGGLPGKFNAFSYQLMWESLYNQGRGVILEASAKTPYAWLGGIITIDHMTSDTVGFEFFWYCLPDHRGAGALKLLPAFERWCKEHGAVRLWMIHLTHIKAEKMARYYEHAGYELAETFYRKEL